MRAEWLRRDAPLLTRLPDGRYVQSGGYGRPSEGVEGVQGTQIQEKENGSGSGSGPGLEKGHGQSRASDGSIPIPNGNGGRAEHESGKEGVEPLGRSQSPQADAAPTDETGSEPAPAPTPFTPIISPALHALPAPSIRKAPSLLEQHWASRKRALESEAPDIVEVKQETAETDTVPTETPDIPPEAAPTPIALAATAKRHKGEITETDKVSIQASASYW